MNEQSIGSSQFSSRLPAAQERNDGHNVESNTSMVSLVNSLSNNDE